jgi:hypothetical protein
MPNEIDYVKFLMKKYKIELFEKSRYKIMKDFEEQFHKDINDLKFKFRKLENIESKDE